MILISDFKVDDSDDIIINGDILEEESPFVPLIRNVERRVVARYDDFVLDAIAAGLERYVFGTQTSLTVEGIKTSINDALTYSNLLSSSDFDIIVLEQESKRLPILLKFNSPIFAEGDQGFRIIIDIENQRIYRG